MSSNGAPAWMAILMRKGRPRPRLTSKTFEPMAFETAISPNPSLATRMELRQSYTWQEGKRTVIGKRVRYFYDCTHRHACSNSNNHETHHKLINVKDASHSSHKCYHGKAYDRNPKDGHGERGGNHVPFAVLGAVGDGPGEQYDKGKR